MDIRDIRCFLYASETLNFTRTAQRMYMSQQGVSRIIGKLEEELEVPLFYRRNQSLVLSEYGQEFVKTAEAILGSLDGFHARVDTIRAEKRYRLRVAIPSGMLYCFPVEMVSAYMKEHPDIDLNIREYQDFQCEDAVLSGDADLAFCVRGDNPDLRVHFVHTENTYFMISRTNPLSCRDELEVTDLRGQHFLSIAESNVCGGQFIRSCIDNGFEAKVIFRSSDVQLLQKMCAEDVGIGFYVGPYPAELPGVRIVPMRGDEFKWNAYLVSAGTHTLNEVEAEFVRLLRESWY